MPGVLEKNKITAQNLIDLKNAINQIGSYNLLKKETSVVKDTTVKYYCDLTGVLSAYDVINVIFPNETENLSSYPQISIDNKNTYYEIKKGNSLVALRDLQGKANVLYFDGTNWQVVSNVVNDALNIFPVGSLFFSTTPTNPSAWMGGTWQLWGSGRVPVGVDTSQTEFNTVEKTGGEKTHKLTVAESASHSHGFQGGNALFTRKDQDVKGLGGGGYWVEGVGSIPNTSNAGGDQPHNNLQPYITCYMWKRTA